jgi:flagellar motility protein MotE (MotC chaperone)
MTRRCHILRTWRTRLGPLAIAALATVLSGPPAAAQDAATEAALAYCTNLADDAADARFALQLSRLRAAEEAIEERLATLEEKRAEYEEWLERRRQFMELAEQNLVAIYEGMRPDAASEQLAEMNEFTAAAVISKVPPRTASAILNEMEAEKAARLAAIMTGLTRQVSAGTSG